MSLDVGFVGLGIMGSGMSTNLLKAGFKVTGTDVDPARLEEFVANGGTAAKTPAEVAEASDVVILSLPKPEILDTVVNGPDGLLAGAKPGTVLVETSTFPIPIKEAARDAAASSYNRGRNPQAAPPPRRPSRPARRRRRKPSGPARHRRRAKH